MTVEAVPDPRPDADDWDRHWEDYSGANARNPAQEYRRRLALDLLGRDGSPSRLIDIGCGQGDLLLAACRRWPGAELLGLEVSEAGVDVARRRVPSARFVVRDLTAISEPSAAAAGWATHAVCSEVLEHVDQPDVVLRNACAYLAPGCWIVVTVPGGRMSAFDRHIGHRRHFDSQSLRDLLRAVGLDVDFTAGAGFPFFNLYRAAVIARGEKLVDDAARAGDDAPTAAVRAAMAAFRPLFRLNLARSRWGTQIMGLARVPAGT